RLVAVAVPDLCSARAEACPTWGCLTSTAIRARPAVTAARRSEEMAASGDLAAMVATAAACFCQSRSAALAALLVLPERVALAATLLGDRAATAVTAATVGRLMAALGLVGVA